MASKATKSDPILHQEVSDYWESHRCPKCGTCNWTYHSHSRKRESGFWCNNRICRCHKCKTRYWIGMAKNEVAEFYPGRTPEQWVDEQDGNETASFSGTGSRT